ncbi:hypothetical protein Tco_0701062, partial [Tanacetum coccineum]
MEVNMARDSDDALVCCVENTVEDRIMDSGALFHATYCKEELEMFKLRSGKVHLADDKTLDIAGVGDVLDKEGYRVGFGYQQWKVTKGSLVVAHGNKRGSLYMVEDWYEHVSFQSNVLDVRKVDIYFYKPGGLGKQRKLSFMMLEKTRKLQSGSCGRYNANLQFGVAERLSRTFRAESTGIRVEAPKMLWADSVSRTYLIYRIPYFPIGLRIPEEECGSDEMRYSFRDTKSHQSQVVLVDIPENLAENDSIVAEHGLSSEITQSPGGSSDTSEGSKNSGSFEDSRRSDVEYSEDGASSKEGGSETPHVRRSNTKSRALWKKAIIEEMVSLEKNQTCSLVRISAGKKASQRLWMFNVKEEQNGRKRSHSYVGALNDTFTQHKSEGFQLAGQEENLECRLKEIMYGLIQAPRLRYLKFDSFMQKDKVDDMLVAGSDIAEFNKPKWVLIFVEDSWNEEPCSDVHQVGDEREVEVLRSFNWPPSELIMEDGVLPKRVQRVPYVRRYRKCVPDVRRYRKVRAVALLKGRWFEVYRDYLRQRAMKWQINDSSGEKPIVALGLRGGLLGANPIPHRVLIFVEDSWNEEPCNDVHQVGDEREVEVLRSIIADDVNYNYVDAVYQSRGYFIVDDVSSGYRVSKVSRPCLVCKALFPYVRHSGIQKGEKPIVALGLRGGLLGANPIPTSLDTIVPQATLPEQFCSELIFSSSGLIRGLPWTYPSRDIYTVYR